MKKPALCDLEEYTKRRFEEKENYGEKVRVTCKLTQESATAWGNDTQSINYALLKLNCKCYCKASFHKL